MTRAYKRSAEGSSHLQTTQLFSQFRRLHCHLPLSTMVLLVEVFSRETVRPSAATPAHLRRMQLSVADQAAPDMYVQILSFFRPDGTAPAAKAAMLKSSLSEALVRFYPLAGRVAGGVLTAGACVDCNDAGAEFHLARVDGDLEEVLRRPPMRELSELLPNGGAEVRPGDPILVVQLSTFACGGTALGVCMSHQVADGASLGMFLSFWAAMARGEEPSFVPRIHTAAVLPPLDLPIQYLGPRAAGRFPSRLIIRAPEMAALRGETCRGAARPPTRFEATVALLWGAIARSRRHTKQKHSWVALLPVNLRKRMEEFSSHSFGNLVAYAIVASADPPAAGGGRGELEKSLREAVRRVDAEYFKGQVEMLLSGELAWEDDGVDTMEFTDWSRLGLHNTDFGWGLPAWQCAPMKDKENVVVFGDADGGAGMEAWLWLPEEVMERLRQDPEVLRFVDPNSFSH